LTHEDSWSHRCLNYVLIYKEREGGGGWERVSVCV
jgi:hypothetical protein